MALISSKRDLLNEYIKQKGIEGIHTLLREMFLIMSANQINATLNFLKDSIINELNVRKTASNVLADKDIQDVTELDVIKLPD